MDAYVFVREATAEGLERLLGMVGDTPGVRAAVPLCGEYAAYAAIGDESPEVAFRALTAVTDVDGLVAIESFLGWRPGGVERLGPLPIPPIPPMPSHMPLRAWVGFVLLTCEPGASASVLVEAAAVEGVVGLAIVTGTSPLVLVQVTADDESALGAVGENVSSLTRVADASTSFGFTELGSGLQVRGISPDN